MTQQKVQDLSDLLAHIHRDWAALGQFLDTLTESQFTQVRNPDGWAVQDHVVHLAVWERSVLAFLDGQGRHEGLGIPESVYLSGDFDAMNAIIFNEYRELALAEAMALSKTTHDELLARVAPMSDHEVRQPFSHFRPDDASGETRNALDIIYGNTAAHYREHLEWIRAMLEDVD